MHGVKRRRTCDGCSRPGGYCVCALIPNVQLDQVSKVWMFTHPHELHRPTVKQTGRFCAKGIENCEVKIGRKFTEHSDLLEAMEKEEFILLFPSKDSISVFDFKKVSSKVNLLVIDASWKQAKEIFNANTELLKDVTKINLGDHVPVSKFTIRKQPQEGTLCTLEAVAFALGVLEPLTEEIQDSLLAPALEIVRQQNSFIQNSK